MSIFLIINKIIFREYRIMSHYILRSNLLLLPKSKKTLASYRTLQSVFKYCTILREDPHC